MLGDMSGVGLEDAYKSDSDDADLEKMGLLGSGGGGFSSLIWSTSTFHKIHSCVADRCGISCVIEFLHGGNPPFALRKCPYLDLNLT